VGDQGFSGGNDYLDGGAGDDWWMEGGSGDDTLLGGEGNDYLHGSLGDDALSGGPGNDTLSGATGNDLLSGGAGDDHIDGGSGPAETNTLVFTRGDGQDAASYIQVLRFGADIAPADVEAGRQGTLVYLFRVRGTQDRLTTTIEHLARVEFHDGTIWDAAFLAALPALATEGNDLLAGTEGNDTIAALGGNDTVHGLGGDDEIDGGAGVDAMYGGAGDDRYYVDTPADQAIELDGDGHDAVFAASSYTLGNAVEDLTLLDASGGEGEGAGLNATGNALDNLIVGNSLGNTLDGRGGADVLVGKGGNDRYFIDHPMDQVVELAGQGIDEVFSSVSYALGDEVENLVLQGGEGGGADLAGTGNALANRIIGSAGSNALRGNAGNDQLEGGDGADTYFFAAGDGLDIVRDDSAGGEANVLRLEGISPESVTLEGTALSLVTVRIGSEAVTLQSGSSALAVARIEFDGGVAWDSQYVGDALGIQPPPPPPQMIVGTDGDDVLVGAGGSDFIRGLFGHDQLFGLAGDDQLDGGPGNDLLAGDAGNDVYLITADVDTIRDPATHWRLASVEDAEAIAQISAAGALNIAFVQSMILGDVKLGFAADTLILRGGEAGVELHIEGFDPADALGDHSVKAFLFPDPANPAGLSVLTYADLLGRGFDHPGTAGDDLLAGTSVQDRYVFGYGSGHDRIVDPGGLDRITLAPGIAPGDIEVSRSATDIVLRLDESNSLSIAWDPAAGAAVEAVAFSGHEAWDAATLEALAGPPTGGNSAPVANGDALAATEDTVAVFAALDLLGNDTDADGDTLTIVSVTSGTGGTAELNADGTVTFTPTADFNGAANFGYVATDGEALSAPASATVSVAAVNDAPMPADDALDALEDTPLVMAATDLLGNDVDVDGDALAIGAVIGGSGGTAVLNPDGTVTFTPHADFNGAAHFTYVATDGAAAGGPATVTLDVAPVNDAPVFTAPLGDLSAEEDAPFSFRVPAGTVIDADPGDALEWFAARADGSALPQWLRFDGDSQTLSGTPLQADVGSFDLRLTASDGVASASDAFTLTVRNVNDAPLLANAIAWQSFEAGSKFAFTLPPGTFADPDPGDRLALSARLHGGGALPAWLKFDAASGTFTGKPGKHENGISRIVVTATDAAGAQASGEFGLVIRARPNSTVVGEKGDDVLYAGLAGGILVALGGNDALFGHTGNDLLLGGSGLDLLQGGAGADVLHGGRGQNLLDGGAGHDLILGGRASSLIVGGAGNDVISTGSGRDVLLFNRGDGSDRVHSDRGGDNTLSFGGGIGYADLSLSRKGKDLVLSAGQGDRVVLEDWYAGKRSVRNLQFVHDGGQVASFDFLGLVGEFDRAQRASPGLTSWQVTNALMQFHLSGSDDAALGGDLAYWYARNRGLAGISLQAAQQVIGAAGFGSEAQSLRPFNGLQEGFVKLT
jgi:Ca2+-binding RTX toxin-like protein